MGYLYKLKPAVERFIIIQKRNNSSLSSRKLAEVASSKFSFSISKSSVNLLLKQKGLSSPVGRRTKKRINIQGEILHGGFSILQGVDYKLGISNIVAKTLFDLQPGASRKLLADMENTIQALAIFKSIFDITIEPTRCYRNNDIWTLVGSRPSRSVYNQILSAIEKLQLTADDIVTSITRFLTPVSGFRFQLRDNSNFFIDAELQSIWSTPIVKGSFYTTYGRAMSYVDSFFGEDQILPIFNVQGSNLYSPEVLDFISALNGQNLSKRIRNIEIIDYEGNVIETRAVENPNKRFFLLGFWPWQLETIPVFERKPAGHKLTWSDFGTEHCYQIEEVDLSQHLVAQEVKYLTLLLKSSPLGAVKVGILTNMPEDTIHNYLSTKELYHWIQPESMYKKFIQRVKKPPLIDLTLQPEQLEAAKIKNSENNLDNIFATLAQIIFHQFQQKILPDSCRSWSQLKIKDVFLRQKAIIKRSKEYLCHNILIDNELCKENDIRYICNQLNDPGLMESRSKLPWFSYTKNHPNTL